MPSFSTVYLADMPDELRPGMQEILLETPDRFSLSPVPGCVCVNFHRDSRRSPHFCRIQNCESEPISSPESSVTSSPRYPDDDPLSKSGQPPSLTVVYKGKVAAFRALGCCLGQLERNEDTPRMFDPPREEMCQMDTVGCMIDLSRNAVMTVDGLKNLLRRCALMGINMLLLYMEDTYEVSAEGVFGYQRGRYTSHELQDVDTYAQQLGLDVVPCMQTLGHLSTLLQWPRFNCVRDTHDVLLVDSPGTTHLIGSMLDAATAPFRSSYVHVGLLFQQHTGLVHRLCREAGLQPLMWSDMLFCAPTRNFNLSGYYDTAGRNPDSSMDLDFTSSMPQNELQGMELIYWDYYHTNQDAYARMIERHVAINGKLPWVACGLWTWNRMWSALPFAFDTIGPCMNACKGLKVRRVFTTLWEDDGAEVDPLSALPALQFFADHSYSPTPITIDDRLAENFEGTCGGCLEHFIEASELDQPLPPPSLPNDTIKHAPNPSKWLLWNDILLGLLDPQLPSPDIVEAHYTRLASLLKGYASSSAHPLNARLALPAQLARVLSLKVTLRSKLQAAYRRGDVCELTAILNERVRPLCREVDGLWRCHRRHWLDLCKPFGLEVLEGRYGTLRTRLSSLEERLDDFLNHRVSSIPELEVDLQQCFGQGPTLGLFDYSRCTTAGYR